MRLAFLHFHILQRLLRNSFQGKGITFFEPRISCGFCVDNSSFILTLLGLYLILF
jgi:hypothetical protein